MVDEGAGAAGTDAVHALFYISAFKIDDFGVFTAKFDSNICLRGVILQCTRDGNHFLDKRNL